MIRARQKKLSKLFFEQLKHDFPELKLVGISECPDDPDIIMVDIIPPKGEKRRLDLDEKASLLSAEFLEKYDEYFIISDVSTPEESPVH